MKVTIDEVTLGIEIDGAIYDLEVGIGAPDPVILSQQWVEHQVREFLGEHGALTNDSFDAVMEKLALLF